MAEIQNIELKDGEPVTLTVKMTTEDAAWIASQAGRTTGDKIAGDLYEDLTGQYFNRFWDAGLPGYLEGEDHQ